MSISNDLDDLGVPSFISETFIKKKLVIWALCVDLFKSNIKQLVTGGYHPV
jgi:hypothetical protein